MSSIDCINAEIASLGRPAANWLAFRAPGGPLGAAKEWDRLNPVLAARYVKLCEARERLEEADQVAKLVERNTGKMRKRMSELGLGRALAAAESANLDRASLQFARDWFYGDKSWLILSGSVGVGKTTAATWVLREVLLRGQTVGMVRSSDVAQLQIEGKVRELERVHLLLIDDIGVEHPNQFAQSVLGQLCDVRHQLIDVRTIITTNLTREDLEKRVGERVADRWRESSVMKRSAGGSLRRPE